METKNWGNQTITSKSFLMPPTYKDKEDLTAADLETLKLHAENMAKLVRYSKSDVVIARKPDIRNELMRVVEFLYQYNINLTNLLGA